MSFEIGYIKVLTLKPAAFPPTGVKIIIDGTLDGSGSGISLPANAVGFAVNGEYVDLFEIGVERRGKNSVSIGPQHFSKYRDGSNAVFTTLAALITYLNTAIYGV